MAKTRQFKKARIIFQAKKTTGVKVKKYTARLFAVGGKKRIRQRVIVWQKLPNFLSIWAGCLFIGVLITNFLFWPKMPLQIALSQNSRDLETNLKMADFLLSQNKFIEAEKALKISQQLEVEGKFLGKNEINEQLAALWQRKHLTDPKDISLMIGQWEKIVKQKPNYRDGYVQLSLLYLSLRQKSEALENIQKAYLLDPNSPWVIELKKEIEALN